MIFFSAVHKLYPYVAGLLIYVFTPGLCDITETLVHFIEEGDWHVSDEERHSGHDDSDSGGEQCHSHSNIVFVAPSFTKLEFAIDSLENVVFLNKSVVSDAVVSEILRPPIA